MGDEYNEYDGYKEEDYEYDEDIKIINNAWVWKLLILSFALGVCSCLCYYATKVRPSGGKKRYDFGHGRHGKYSQVGLESAQSAYDHDDIIDHQSVIDQSD